MILVAQVFVAVLDTRLEALNHAAERWCNNWLALLFKPGPQT